MLIVLGGK